MCVCACFFLVCSEKYLEAVSILCDNLIQIVLVGRTRYNIMENETFKTEYIRLADEKNCFSQDIWILVIKILGIQQYHTKLPYQFIPKLSEITVNFEYFDLFTVRLAVFFRFDLDFDCLCSSKRGCDILRTINR